MATAIKRAYLLTYLLPSSLTETEVKAHQDTLAALLKKHKGSVTQLEEWGKRRLAYKIKHAGKWYTDAYYLHYLIEMEASHLAAFGKDVHLQSQIMRHLLTVAPDTSGKEEAAE
jgi:small subunit ribosomal protein S6